MHKKCFECTLCGLDAGLLDEFKFSIEPKSKKIEVYCNICDAHRERHRVAHKRLQEIQALSIHELLTLLRDRDVPCAEGEGKPALVCKVVVTEPGEPRRTEHLLGLQVGACLAEQHLNTSRAAPGADLANRRCSHGVHYKQDDTAEQAKKRKAINDFMQSDATAGFYDRIPKYILDGGKAVLGLPNLNAFQAGCMKTVDFWSERQEILKSDMERFIPRALWSAAVNPDEVGFVEYSRMTVTAALITKVMIASLQNKSRLTDNDMVRILHEPQLKRTLRLIGNDDPSLYAFMHSEEHRVCDCIVCGSRGGPWHLEHQTIQSA